MESWYDDECNKFFGSDGTIYPPFRKKEDGFSLFIPQMCRAFNAKFDRRSKYAKIKGNRFLVDLGTSETPDPKCYCREDHCPMEGTFDLFPCIGTPMIVTLPHFHKGNSSVHVNAQYIIV